MTRHEGIPADRAERYDYYLNGLRQIHGHFRHNDKVSVLPARILRTMNDERFLGAIRADLRPFLEDYCSVISRLASQYTGGGLTNKQVDAALLRRAMN